MKLIENEDEEARKRENEIVGLKINMKENEIVGIWSFYVEVGREEKIKLVNCGTTCKVVRERRN